MKFCEPALVSRTFYLASFILDNNIFAQIIAHAEPVNNIIKVIDQAKIKINEQFKEASVSIPKGAYTYILGSLNDGSRYLVGTPINGLH
jgi:hypothetical protein